MGAQVLRFSQLAKEHGHKLCRAVKTSGVPLDAMFVDQLLKLELRKKLEQLGEDAGEPVYLEFLLGASVFERGTGVQERSRKLNSHIIRKKLIWRGPRCAGP